MHPRSFGHCLQQGREVAAQHFTGLRRHLRGIVGLLGRGEGWAENSPTSPGVGVCLAGFQTELLVAY